MKASADPPHEISLQDVVGKIHQSLGDQTGGPTPEELGAVCDVLYAASLLKVEGKLVIARDVIAPPEGFHAVRFTASHVFTQNEIKRMSPAAPLSTPLWRSGRNATGDS